MTKIVIIFLFVQLLGSCSTFSNKRGLASLSDIEIDDIKEQQVRIENFILLAEKNLAWRAQAIDFYKYLEDDNHSLSNKDLVNIHKEGTLKYLKMREELYKHVDNIRWITGKKVEINADAKKTGTELGYIITEDNRYLDGPDSEEPIKIVTINPESDAGKYLINEIKLGFAAATILTDNYIAALSPYQSNIKFRNIINRDNVKYENALKEIVRSFYDKSNFEEMVRARAIYDHVVKGGPMVKAESYLTIKLPVDQTKRYLKTLIEASYTYQNIKNVGYSFLRKKYKEEIRRHFADRFRKLLKGGTHLISKGFGNGAGIFASRKGKLYKMGKLEQGKVANKLKALDILLEKTPFRLTDSLIPGHWGHVAIWTGTAKELKELGVWKQLPKLYNDARNFYKYRGESFQQAVKSGHMIIEALRPGVQINTLEHFLNIDDLGVIRRRGLSKEEKVSFLLHAFEQIGKSYDFNFDVDTDERIVCSELAYVVFNDMEWPKDKALGRDTISPDHVAVKAKNNSDPFVPIIIYHDGKQINKKLRKNYNRLLELKYNEITF